jgi:histidinol dehydrogenase
MRLLLNPEKNSWPDYMIRENSNSEKIREQVREIINSVRKNGDEALLQFTRAFDRIALRDLRVSKKEISDSAKLLETPLKEAIEKAKANIWSFHASQKINSNKIETSPGVACWRESRAIEKVGLYIPAGTAPLFSTLLMLGIPAKIAGCKKIVVCSAPQPDGKVHPNILFCANLLGLDEVYAVGGAQAIAAMAYGTQSIPACDKIFGPGNQYVTAAKEIVQSEKCSIDMPAGPSEVLVIADEIANPGFVASDLLSQAEHGEDSQVILLSTSQKLCEEVLQQIETQIQELDRKEIAEKALENSSAIALESIEQCFEFSNQYAPEHLILSKDDESWINAVESAGSVFIGPYSCESAGDYASGTNHTLPTNAWARSVSGLGLSSFQKCISFQRISAEGLEDLGPSIEVLAEAENLSAHRRAVSIRLQALAKSKNPSLQL